uniref:Nuclear protein MDM1 n=1 Tax=Glossina pallidipes TaxID=7398 RepID=A0A1A9ZRT7_GLOPL
MESILDIFLNEAGRCRGWGIEIDPDLYKKQKDLWDQVSKNSSLSALSLASAMHRPITKEEKEQENNKKTAPLTIKPQKARVPGQAFFLDNKDEMHALPARFHHTFKHSSTSSFLQKDVEEGALLPSPTREKLMPAITKRESESQRGSPKKTAASRHGSPQKGSPQKGSPKKIIKKEYRTMCYKLFHFAEDSLEVAIKNCVKMKGKELHSYELQEVGKRLENMLALSTALSGSYICYCGQQLAEI